MGLSLALIMRLGLLSVMSWLVTLTTPLFSVGPLSPSGRDLILMVGRAARRLVRAARVRELLGHRHADRGAGCGVLAGLRDHRRGHGGSPGHHDDRRHHRHRHHAAGLQAPDALRQCAPDRGGPVPGLPLDDRLFAAG
ncbi:hypothetical protein G6F65_021574 [Rhizopus arrhizus]|nr:hypothetical protein G6F65_021574 [Rhizopus arrhizus]